MSAGLLWAVILGAVATIGLLALVPLWMEVRYPERAPHGAVPAYLRRAGARVVRMRREALEYGGAHTRAAA